MLAGTAEVFTVTVPAWLLAALAFLGTVLGGAISFAVNQLLIKGAADRAAKKREKEMNNAVNGIFADGQPQGYIRPAILHFVPALSGWKRKLGRFYWNGELKRGLSHLEGVDERYRESDQRQLAELNTRNK